MLARLGRGRTVHVVHYRPDLPGRWRSACGRARSATVETSSDRPACAYCRDTLLDAVRELDAQHHRSQEARR